jgi:probable HAF family extracellular repeat protein
VVGFSNPPGAGDPEGEFISRAFRWVYGAVKADDLGALPGDVFSEAFAINAHGQVVGGSFGGSSGSRAFIWQNGALANLNDLVDIAPDVLVSAQDINDAGQITGRVRDGVTGEILAFVATTIANGQPPAARANWDAAHGARRIGGQMYLDFACWARGRRVR